MTTEQAVPPPSQRQGIHPGKLLPWLLALLLLARLPFLADAFCGEDGLFAMMAVNTTGAPIPDPNRPFLTARRGRRLVWSGPAHPILPYWIPARLLRPLTAGIDFSSLSLNRKSMLARGMYLLFFLPVPAVLFVLAGWMRRPEADRQRAWLALALLAYVGCCRPLLTGSVQPQQDGSYGLMQTALVILLLFLTDRARTRAGRAACCLAAGFLGGLGKHEWSLALLAATWCVVLLVRARRRLLPGAGEEKAAFTPAAVTGAASALCLGLLLGNALSYAADPVNYRGGIQAMLYFAGHGRNWVEISLHRLPRLYHLFVLVPLALTLACKDRGDLLRNRPAMLTVLLFGLALTGGFSLNAVSTKTRYFCPGYFALLAFALVMLQRATLRPARARALAWVFAVLCVGDFAYSCARITTLAPGTRARRKLERALARTRAPGGLPLVSSYVPYYHPEVDYLNSSGYLNTPGDLRRARTFFQSLRAPPPNTDARERMLPRSTHPGEPAR